MYRTFDKIWARLVFEAGLISSGVVTIVYLFWPLHSDFARCAELSSIIDPVCIGDNFLYQTHTFIFEVDPTPREIVNLFPFKHYVLL